MKLIKFSFGTKKIAGGPRGGESPPWQYRLYRSGRGGGTLSLWRSRPGLAADEFVEGYCMWLGDLLDEERSMKDRAPLVTGDVERVLEVLSGTGNAADLRLAQMVAKVEGVAFRMTGDGPTRSVNARGMTREEVVSSMADAVARAAREITGGTKVSKETLAMILDAYAARYGVPEKSDSYGFFERERQRPGIGGAP